MIIDRQYSPIFYFCKFHKHIWKFFNTSLYISNDVIETIYVPGVDLMDTILLIICISLFILGCCLLVMAATIEGPTKQTYTRIIKQRYTIERWNNSCVSADNTTWTFPTGVSSHEYFVIGGGL